MVYAVNIADYFEPAQKFSTFANLVSVLLPNLYLLSGVIFLVLLIFGGLSLIMGAGGGDPQKAGQGKKAVTTAIIGFLLIFASWWIIQIIEVITGIDILKGGL